MSARSWLYLMAVGALIAGAVVLNEPPGWAPFWLGRAWERATGDAAVIL